MSGAAENYKADLETGSPKQGEELPKQRYSVGTEQEDEVPGRYSITPQVCMEDMEKRLTPEMALESIRKSEAEFGLFVIARTHISTSEGSCLGLFITVFVRVCVLLLLLSQWAVPLFLFAAKLNTSRGVCTSSAPWQERCVIAIIAFIYYVRQGSRRFEVFFKALVARAAESKSRTRYGLKEHSRLRKYNALDSFMNVGYTSIIMAIMLWMTYRTNSVMDMVFNCLAMEFLSGVDNEFVAVYLKFAEWSLTYHWSIARCGPAVKLVDLSKYIKYKGDDEDSTSRTFADTVTTFQWVLGGCATLWSFFMIFYGPICKDGGATQG